MDRMWEYRKRLSSDPFVSGMLASKTQQIDFSTPNQHIFEILPCDVFLKANLGYLRPWVLPAQSHVVG